jgi:hypothetical protein
VHFFPFFVTSSFLLTSSFWGLQEFFIFTRFFFFFSVGFLCLIKSVRSIASAGGISFFLVSSSAFLLTFHLLGNAGHEGGARGHE